MVRHTLKILQQMLYFCFYLKAAQKYIGNGGRVYKSSILADQQKEFAKYRLKVPHW